MVSHGQFPTDSSHDVGMCRCRRCLTTKPLSRRLICGSTNADREGRTKPMCRACEQRRCGRSRHRRISGMKFQDLSDHFLLLRFSREMDELPSSDVASSDVFPSDRKSSQAQVRRRWRRRQSICRYPWGHTLSAGHTAGRVGSMSRLLQHLSKRHVCCSHRMYDSLVQHLDEFRRRHCRNLYAMGKK